MEEEKLSTIDESEIALKCTTKAEVYKVLTITGGVCLPPIEQINSDFVRDILTGDKLVSYDNHFIVHILKPSQDYRSASYRGIEDSRCFEFCKGALRNKFAYARIWMRKVSIHKVDLKFWYGNQIINHK